VTLGVVIPCYRQERFLPRTVAALERALADRDWRGVLVLASPGEAAEMPSLSGRWSVRHTPQDHAMTPGAARNLGFASCGGAYVLFVDADVEVDAAWVTRALGVLAADPAVAGAWGRLEEWFVDAHGERPGVRDLNRVGDLDHDCELLAGIALYRRDALERVGGYEPRLSSEEDFELGLRLRREGFRLRSLGPFAARHWSGPRPSFSEIGRRWRTGLCFGQGQVLRLYLGRPGFAALARRQGLFFAVLALWLAAVPAVAAGGAAGAAVWALAPLGLLALMAVRKRSVKLALHALLTWTVHAAGLVVGFARGGVRPPASEGAC
jgi:glycosyltransferase involved in cell wall biosynthesis